MDFIVSYHLYNKIKKMEMKENLIKKDKPIELINTTDNSIPNKTCPQCGQDPYLCQCQNNIQCIYKNFKPEKDIY